MKKALFIMQKEVMDFIRDKGDLAFSLILPVAIFALMYGAFGGSLQFNGTAYIVNEDASGQYADSLLRRLENYDGLKVKILTAEDADSKLSRSNILLAVFIPADFSEKLAAAQPVQLVFKQRGNGGTEGQIVASLVQGAAEGVGQAVQVQNHVKTDLTNSGISPRQIEITVQRMMAEEQAGPGVAIQESTVGSSPDPVNQYLPGIMTMFVLFAVNLTAQALVDERRKGTLERLLATRLKMGELFAGKFLAYTARGFVQTTVLLLLAYAVFRFFTPVSFLESLVLALIFSAACSTIGLIIGSLSKTQNQATWISVFFTMLMVMISGTFVAVSEGTMLGTLSKFSINTYANDAFRTVINQGGSLADVRTEILVMVGVAVVGLVISRFLFRATQGGR
jgi:ABC-2 type transport system permease protein